ncbi:PspC domain-containing protein [Arthrobacter agilis]|jgi:phage shock protein PspC (stress-responsive transcriptional regulator)|uniref:PspC domain-containing protein n=1 Tax=Arthrobacter agilis TaxID=37921 RepID=UPI002789857C|nr:PspC domain-containing protein [Arthrobacter agilis]MDQ0735827.1 phage shock protein C [Arthrobacter agilis]
MQSFYQILRSSPVKRAPGGIFGGIASGIARQYGWRVSYVRIGMLLSFLLPFIGLPLYLVLWLLLPATDGTIVLEKLLRR